MLEQFHPVFARWCSTKFAVPTAGETLAAPLATIDRLVLDALSNDIQRRAQIG
jgi:hypothetical protein